jgi:DNA-binding CsgD family transcriptional regulator
MRAESLSFQYQTKFAAIVQSWDQKKAYSDNLDYFYQIADQPLLQTIMLHNQTQVMVLNVATRAYNFCSDGLKSITGYDPSIYLQGEASVLISQIPTAFQLCYLDQMRQQRGYYQSLSQAERKQFLSISQFPMLAASGVKLLMQCQELILETDSDGNVIATLQLLSEVSRYIPGRTKVLQLLRAGQARDAVFIYDLENQEKGEVLTRSEIEIWKTLMTATSPTEAALRLHISPHTAATHRRNLYKKIDINTLAGLVKLGVVIDIC